MSAKGWRLCFGPPTGVEVTKRSAEEIFDILAECAWKSGDPGILFIDRINRANPIPGLGKLEATNPCGEQPLLPYESCTLGSINLTRIVDQKGLDFQRLEELVHLSVHFLDNVVEINRYGAGQIAKSVWVSWDLQTC